MANADPRPFTLSLPPELWLIIIKLAWGRRRLVWEVNSDALPDCRFPAPVSIQLDAITRKETQRHYVALLLRHKDPRLGVSHFDNRPIRFNPELDVFHFVDLRYGLMSSFGPPPSLPAPWVNDNHGMVRHIYLTENFPPGVVETGGTNLYRLTKSTPDGQFSALQTLDFWAQFHPDYPAVRYR